MNESRRTKELGNMYWNLGYPLVDVSEKWQHGHHQERIEQTKQLFDRIVEKQVPLQCEFSDVDWVILWSYRDMTTCEERSKPSDPSIWYLGLSGSASCKYCTLLNPYTMWYLNSRKKAMAQISQHMFCVNSKCHYTLLVIFASDQNLRRNWKK